VGISIMGTLMLLGVLPLAFQVSLVLEAIGHSISPLNAFSLGIIGGHPLRALVVGVTAGFLLNKCIRRWIITLTNDPASMRTLVLRTQGQRIAMPKAGRQ